MSASLPSVLLGRLHDGFEEHRDPERAAGMSAYMRGQFPFLGIPTPQRRALSRTAVAGLPAPEERELAVVARRCWRRAEREYQYFACDYVGRHVSRCSPAFLGELRWLVTHKSWWDTVDALAHATGTLVQVHPSLVDEMDRWVDDSDFWIARVALLHQLGARDRTDTDRLFAYCERRAGDTELFIRKAIGWALREYSKTDPDAVVRFVEDQGAGLSPLSRREALEVVARLR